MHGPGRVGNAKLTVWAEQQPGDLIRICAVLPIDQRDAARTFSSLSIRPFQNRHKEGRIIVWREHEHRQPLSDRRWAVSNEPDEIRTRRNNHSSKVVLRSRAHDTPHSGGEVIVSERRWHRGTRHCHRNLLSQTLGIRAVSASPAWMKGQISPIKGGGW